jgi:putative ABC transport system permease protein
MLIMQYVFFEYSFDRFHDNASLKYRTSNTAPMALGPAAHDELAYVVRYARLHPVYRDATITRNQDSYLERNLYFADSAIFSILTFPIIEGDAGKLFPQEINWQFLNVMPGNTLETKILLDKSLW